MPQLAETLPHWWIVPLAYLVGATPFGFLAGKMRGIDIREHGSGNIGATNVLRTLGKPIGITVLCLDMLKGLLPVLVARLLADSSVVPIVVALATILGHNYTFWLGFKGGKGIATTGGALLVLIPLALALAALLWLATLKLTGYVSVASLAAVTVVPVAVATQSLLSGEWDLVLLAFTMLIWVLAIWKHRGNIARLRRGEEHRFGAKPSPRTSSDPPS